MRDCQIEIKEASEERSARFPRKKKLRIKDGNTKYINLFCERENGNQSSCGDIVTRTILGRERRRRKKKRRRENQFSPSEISGTKCWGEEGEGNSTFGRFGCSKNQNSTIVQFAVSLKELYILLWAIISAS